MRGKILKNKLILTALTAILLVSCGGSGGGGGSSNLPINSGNNVLPTPKKPEIEDKINPAIPENTVNPTVPVPNNPTNPSNPVNNMKRESLEELRARMDETKVREFILKEQNDSTENIPMDDKKLDGTTQKVAILDSDFLKKKQYFKNIYSNVDILDKTSNSISNSNHGELVLKALREENKLGIIASSIGKETIINGEKIDTVVPTLTDYQNALNKFNPNQKVKVFSQSWGVPNKIGEYRRGNDAIAAIAPGGNLVEGQKILDFYREQVNKDTLFVWANGNTSEGVVFDDAYFQAGLPHLYRDLEKGWIAVVGVKNQEGDIFNTHYSPSHLAYPGNAKWWAISANAELIDSKGQIHRGSSFAAPRVARVASLVAEKYDWMTADQVRQTLFTTTDTNETRERGIRNIVSEPDSKYG